MPSKSTFSSAGKISQHIIPGAYSRIDSVKGAAGFVSANKGVIMGQGFGPKPLTLYQFNSAAEALEVIKGGELLEAVRLSFDPGDGLSPQSIYAMVVNSAVQSSQYLKAAGAQNLIKLTSVLYGLFTNQIQVSVAAGTTTGKKVVLTYRDNVETFDDIVKPLMTLQYTGGACTVTIVNNSTTHTLVTSVGGLSLDLTNYATIGELVAYINNVTSFVATISPGMDNVSPLQLDQVTASSINPTALTLEASMYGIIDAINAGSALVTAEDVSAATGNTVVANLANTYFTSGSNGSYTATEWGDALEALEAEEVQFIATPSTDASVHAAIKAHCVLMETATYKKERQFFVGGAWGESVATAASAAQTLRTYLGTRVTVGKVDYDVNGTLANFAPSYVACMLMAMKCAVALNMPLTAKQITAVSLEKKLRTSELETLLVAGVCPVGYSSTGLPVVVRQLTTYQQDDLKYNELSMVTEMFFVSRDLRTFLDQTFTGNPGVKTVLDSLKGLVESKLRQYVELGLFAEDSLGRTFWGLTIRVAGDTVYIDYNANIVAPINFMFITQHFSVAV